jgi:hypothetical protein
VEQALLTAGWSPEQVADGLSSFADVDFLVPVPKPRAQLSARDAFRYLVMFGTLYVAAFQFGQLLFQFVNLAIADELAANVNRVYWQIRWATSALIVSYPIFLYTSYRITVEIAQDPTRRNSAVRRWLTYVTLFLAVSIITGDLIALLFNFLSGEVTFRFLLKFAIVAVIAGSVFSYYLWSMKADDKALAR